MKKLFAVICVFIGLYFFSVTAYADSPVTSTPFSGAYQDIAVVKQANDTGIMNSEIANYLSDPKNSIDTKAAVINALSWGPDNKANTKEYCMLIYKKTPEKISINDLSGDQLFCIGYLMAMDNYYDTAPALKYLKLAEQKISNSFTVSVVRALVESMDPEPTKSQWDYIQPLLQDSSLKKDMRENAVNIILDYMATYSEGNQLQISNNNVMIRNEKSLNIYLYGTYQVEKNQVPYKITGYSDIANAELCRDEYGIYYVKITGVKNGLSSINVSNDEGKNVTIHFSVVSKDTYSKLNNIIAMYIGNGNSYIGKTNKSMTKKEIPYLKSGKVFIPVRFASKAANGSYQYDSKTAAYHITYGSKSFVLKAKSKWAVVNGKSSVLKNKTELKSGILFIAIQDFCNLFNKKYVYDNGLIFISDKAILINKITDDYILDEIIFLITQGNITIHEPVAFLENGQYGFKDDSGKVIISPAYHMAYDFSDGLAAVSVVDSDGKEKFGFINTKGKFVIDPAFDKALSFHQGLAPVLSGDGTKWGYIDVNGKLMIPYNFTDGKCFSEGIAAVQVDQKWGFVDRTGNYVLQPVYEEADGFSNGLAFVKIDGASCQINMSGQIVQLNLFSD